MEKVHLIFGIPPKKSVVEEEEEVIDVLDLWVDLLHIDTTSTAPQTRQVRQVRRCRGLSFPQGRQSIKNEAQVLREWWVCGPSVSPCREGLGWMKSW